MGARSLVAVVVVVIIAYAGFKIDQTVPILTGHCAKYLCSAHFVAGREVQEVIENDFFASQPIFAKVLYFGMQGGNRVGTFVSVRAFGYDLWTAHAFYRQGLGCTLHLTLEDEAAQPYTLIPEARSRKLQGVAWPLGDDFESNLNSKVQAVLGAYINQNNGSFFTRQIVVVHNGKLVGDAHAPGFPPTMPLLGWSMTKSVINYFVGRLVELGKMKITDQEYDSSDPRSTVTVDQLLRMSSSLEFGEIYNGFSDATRMLFIEKSTAEYASKVPLAGPPDSIWYYSSGTSNILSHRVKQAVGGTLGDYYKWVREEFFLKLGITSGVIEPDAAGTFVGSSFMWATARDWAKFGLLYLQDGIWDGERVLPENWTNYSSFSTPKSNDQYGAHFWLTDLNGFHPDAYYARGFQGQAICISPHDNLIIVRLGLDNFESGARRWEPVGLYDEILNALQ